MAYARAKDAITSSWQTLSNTVSKKTEDGDRFQSFDEFYTFYLSEYRETSGSLGFSGRPVPHVPPDTGEHKNETSRRLHVVGTTSAAALLAIAAARGSSKTLVAVPLVV